MLSGHSLGLQGIVNIRNRLALLEGAIDTGSLHGDNEIANPFFSRAFVHLTTNAPFLIEFQSQKLGPSTLAQRPHCSPAE